MLESLVAIVPFQKPPALDAAWLQNAVAGLEPGADANATPAAGGSVELRLGRAGATVSVHHGSMPKEAALSSIGMAEIPEAEAQRLASHGAYVLLESTDSAAPPMEQMIALIKGGMALCALGGWALCIPSSGLCILASDLQQLALQNQLGPRVWGVDDAEGALPAYQPRGLWESLRTEAQPARLLIGFVPAQVEHKTWFFSAGHSSFDLPELAYSDGTLEDFTTIRDLFRYIFPYFYQHPEKLRGGNVVKTADSSLTISIHELPPRFANLQASTGTLRIRIAETTQVDSEWDEV